MTRKVTCDECAGRGFPAGKVPDWSREDWETAPMKTCPWCDGTGKQDFALTVRAGGWNGDFPFSEVWDVKFALTTAKALGERLMRKDRYKNVLEDGTPTIQWVEVSGPGVLIGLDNENGNWTEA